MRVAWTGHRPDLFRNPHAAHERLIETARELLLQSPLERFLAAEFGGPVAGPGI